MSEISKKDRFTVPAVICLICNVLLFVHLCGAGAYAGGNLHYEAANTQMERNEEFFHQFFLSNHLMGIAETLAMVAALIALLMVIHVWWKSAVERRTKLRDLCVFNGIILLISVYELVAHGGLTAYRDEMPLHYFGGPPATTLLIWLPCLVLTLIPMIVYFRTKRITPAD